MDEREREGGRRGVERKKDKRTRVKCVEGWQEVKLI